MTVMHKIVIEGAGTNGDGASLASDAPAFDAQAREVFAANYPETPHVLQHRLARCEAFQLDALARLAGRLPEASIEYNRGDLPLGVNGKPGTTGLSIEETIRHIATSNSWAVLKNIEQAPAYAELLHDLLDELREPIEARTGAMLRPQGFVFISSPNAVTPYHFDPEHNILLQLAGTKVMTQFPAGDAHYAPDRTHESYHSGGARELVWRDELAAGGIDFELMPGDAVYVPVMAPHYVRNGPASSISLSITWRSEWSFAEAEARNFNHLLRRAGLNPAAPRRWPHANGFKSLAWKMLRKAGLVG